MSIVRTWKNRATGKLTNRLTIRVEYRLDLDEMANGLVRDIGPYHVHEEMLEMRLSGAKILDHIRTAYGEHGNDVWTWSDDVSAEEAEEAREWARGQIIAAFPEMGENR